MKQETLTGLEKYGNTTRRATRERQMRARVKIAGLTLAALAVAVPAVTRAESRPKYPTSEGPAPSSQVQSVIFDTDIWADIDDMLALAMLHALQDRGEVKLLAVTISTDNPWCASYVDLINTFYGHSDIPIGIVHDGVTAEALPKIFPSVTWPITRYTEIISQMKTKDGSPLYPHHLVDGTKALEATSLLRKTLAAQPDGSVVMIEVGYHTNLARLLESRADASSPLDGSDLVRKKVRLLSVMAGNFHETQWQGKTTPRGDPEFNLQVDVPAAQKVFSNWPTPIVDSGTEIGLAMFYPGRTISHDFAYVEHHPIADTYRVYCEEMKMRDPKIYQCPHDHDHATFDLSAVLYAARPNRDYFSLSKPGTITVLNDGGSRFQEFDGGMHRYLELTEEQRARTLEAMMMLASQPPVKTHDVTVHYTP